MNKAGIITICYACWVAVVAVFCYILNFPMDVVLLLGFVAPLVLAMLYVYLSIIFDE